MEPIALFKGELSPDCHQIHLCDAGLPALPDDDSDAATARRVMAGPDDGNGGSGAQGMAAVTG